MSKIIGITGGIGAGKSVISNILRALNFPVYDCDTEARNIMNHNVEIKQRIAAEITPEAINTDGSINRMAIANCVFSNKEKLQSLNSIVHGAVKAHFEYWCESHSHQHKLLFVETAILYESGFDTLVDKIWEVTAPKEIRIQRVIKRNNISREDIIKRIENQSTIQHTNHIPIVNDNNTPVIPQILKLLK